MKSWGAEKHGKKGQIWRVNWGINKIKEVTAGVLYGKNKVTAGVDCLTYEGKRKENAKRNVFLIIFFFLDK